MRLLALIAVLMSFPFFLYMVKNKRWRPWLVVFLAAMPIILGPLNLDASFIAWPHWKGYTVGLTITMADTLALAICLVYGNRHRVPKIMMLFLLYFIANIPAFLMSGYFTPSLFFIFQIMRISLFFYAIYIVIMDGYYKELVYGLSIAVIISGGWSIKDAVAGASQAQGILGHQNLSGMATNLCIPLIVAEAIRTRRWLHFLAIAMGLAGGLMGGSRASIVMLAFTMSATVLALVIMRPTGRTMALAGLMAVGLVAASPFAFQKFAERGVTVFAEDGERVAFESAAKTMINENPWGVGINQFVTVANMQGYYTRAGVRWGQGARGTSVHNVYLLIRAESGLIGLAGFMLWLLVPIVAAIRILFKRGMAFKDAGVASGLALVGVALHSQYEWVTLNAVPQYLIALMIGVIAAVGPYSARLAKERKRASSQARAQREEHRLPEPASNLAAS